TKYKASPLLAVTGNRFKYIQTARPELYDLIDDPGETHNLVDAQSQRARILQDVLGVMLEESLEAGTPDSALELDEESLKKLASLGYVGPEKTPEPRICGRGPGRGFFVRPGQGRS
ncbi:MAG: hypothetical protein ACYS9H_10285, partial [Planctomycetota bacterium]